VSVAYLTGGPASPVRVPESERVLVGLGVGMHRVMQLGMEAGIDDGTLSLKPAAALAALRARFRAADFTRIYLQAWEGGHPDHDASHLIGVRFAAGSAAQVREFPLYNAAGSAAGRFRSLQFTPGAMPVLERRLTAEDAAWWRGLLAAYPSQQQVFAPMRASIDWCLDVRRSCTHRQVDPARDYSLRPHLGPLFYEQGFGLSFEEFRQRLDKP